MSSLALKNRALLFTGFVAMLYTTFPSVAAARNRKLSVTVGQSVTQKLPNNVKTVSIADSDVADVVVAGPREVLINGKGIGLTTLVIWDEFNESTLFDVVVRGPFSSQQIEIRVKLAEVNRNKAFELGFDYLVSDQNGRQIGGALFPGAVSSPSLPLAIYDGEDVEGLTGAFRYFSGGTEFQMMINAAITNGALRILAEPNVVAASGQHASFLSGGEIPVPIASAGVSGGTTITIEWKQFGVSVDFLPTIVDSGVINLKIAPEVSNLDFSSGIQISGFEIPAIRTRKAETTVELKDGEVLVIGGLLLEEQTQFRRRLPLLGSIPLIGYLFSQTDNRTEVKELVLVASPHIVSAMAPGTHVQLPQSMNQKEVEENPKPQLHNN